MKFFDCFKRKKSVKAIEVFFQEGYFHIKLSHGTYEMIYRAARGVYWEPKTQTLYFKGETSKENALQTIGEALQEEYGITLEI